MTKCSIPMILKIVNKFKKSLDFYPPPCYTTLVRSEQEKEGQAK